MNPDDVDPIVKAYAVHDGKVVEVECQLQPANRDYGNPLHNRCFFLTREEAVEWRRQLAAEFVEQAKAHLQRAEKELQTLEMAESMEEDK